MFSWSSGFRQWTRDHDPVRRTIVLSILGLPFLGRAKENVAKTTFSNVKLAPFFAKGDGVTDDRRAVDAALQHASDTGQRLFFPPGNYIIRANGPGAVLMGRSGVWAKFAKGAVLKLENPDNYPLSCFLEHHLVEDVTYIGLALDGGGEIGPNGIGANNSRRILLDRPRITGVRRDPRKGGGRGITFQINCHDIQVNDPVVSDCTSGFDFHGRHDGLLSNVVVNNPIISECEEAISFYDLFDGNKYLDVDSTTQVVINGGVAHNCGKSTDALAPGTEGKDGGIIVSERGRLLEIRNFSVFNQSSYGKIGAVVRGSFSNSKIDVKYEGECVALVMFSPALNLAPVKPNGVAVSQGNTLSVMCVGSCDYVVYSDNGRGVSLASRNRIMANCNVPLVSLMNPPAGKGGEGNYLEVVSQKSSKAVRGDFKALYEKRVSFPDAGKETLY